MTCVLQGEMLTREKQLVKDAAEFLVIHQIPSFVSTHIEWRIKYIMTCPEA